MPETQENEWMESADPKVFRLEKEDDRKFSIRRENDTFVVESPYIERLIKRVPLQSYDAVMRFARIMKNMGVDEELRKRGAKDGQTIRIGDYEFEFVEGE